MHQFSKKDDMANDSQRLIDAATRDELADCVQLLALSIVHHRAKCGFVDFEQTMAQLRSNRAGFATSTMRDPGNKVLEQALKLVATSPIRPSQRTWEETFSDADLAENRRQLRINVTAPIKIVWPDDPVPKAAQLENISWGGAAFQVARARGGAGDRVDIVLPSTRFGSITVQARIIRTWDLPESGGVGIATRFSSLSTRDEAELEDILEVLTQSGDVTGTRKSARLTQRLEVQFDDVGELQATLEDISSGGMGITVPEPLEVGHSFQTIISTLDDRCSLKLRARVVHQDALSLGGTRIYSVGLEFEHPSEELQDRTNELIREMASLNPTTDGDKADDAT